MPEAERNSIPGSILIAEDNDDQARIMEASFRKGGYKVHRVRNGEEAYDVITKGPFPDLLITDIMMPAMSGFELLERLNTEKRMIPTIVLTSKKSQEDALRGYGYGALDFVTKPISPSIVVAKVRALLSKRP